MADAATQTAAGKRSGGRLLAVLGLGFGLAVTVGNTIGSAILRTPGEIAALLPLPGLFLGVWVLGAVYAALGGNAIAELSTMTPRSGGFTIFVGRALGDYAGFLLGVTDWLGTCGSTAAAAIVVGESVAWLSGTGPGSGTVVAFAAVFAFLLVQWSGVKRASATQQVTTVLKAFAFLLLIGAGLSYSGTYSGGVETTIRDVSVLGALVLAFQGVIFAYDGFYGPAYFAGELKNPGRDIPRSIFGGLIAITAIYLLVNVAFLRVLPLGAMAGDPLVASSVARAIFGPPGDVIIRVILVASLLSSINAFQLMASRTFYAVSAKNGLGLGARVNAGGTPTTALLVSTMVAALFVVGGFGAILGIVTFFFVAQYTLSYLGVFVLRRREPDAPRPYRAWGHPWTTGTVLLGSLAFLASSIATDPANSAWALALIALTYPFHLALKRRKGGPGAVS